MGCVSCPASCAHLDLTRRAVDGECVRIIQGVGQHVRAVSAASVAWTGSPTGAPASEFSRNAPLRAGQILTSASRKTGVLLLYGIGRTARYEPSPLSCPHPPCRRSSPWRAGSSLRRPRPGCIRWVRVQVIAICDYLYFGPPGPPFRDLSHCHVVGSAVKVGARVGIATPIRIGERSRQCIGHLRLSLKQVYRPRFFQVQDGDP